ncbi:NAD-dependent epimerase/dehydratase family protein [Streptomyces sp. TRM43335]|uniref:NAD-dependent epimerase/dehydratase family protein n=1 Tax=Streptomyces taklimakanensis TaxID=2569853 RepID=A0A6G2BIT0_9ACTN|nr:NAD-dependent epimerase/dehydratase family protein [Streptomyces taklimakanensis]MTE22197.1 NAD-dependent epimerase/dehydratase family protein [Streptomyces taklimakanensis]
MRLLVLGGTEFVGRAVVEEAIERGWDVTVLHRGRHPAPRGVTALHGDRTEGRAGLAALERAAADGGWDAAVDTWSGAPSAVRTAAALLEPHVGHYAYVSSRSVYLFPPAAGTDEGGPLVDGSSDDTDDADYARAKRGGELATSETFGDRGLLVRAGLILGPYENVGRLPWWLSRVARGGEVLAPGPRALPLQYVDARDLAGWTLDAVARGLGGPYNLVSPPGHTTMGALLENCVRVTGSRAELRWTAPEAILAAGVEPWTDLPVWTPPGEFHDGMHRGDVSRAVAAGLRCRPVAETVADTWDWMRGPEGGVPPRVGRSRVGLAPEREAEIMRSLGGDS